MGIKISEFIARIGASLHEQHIAAAKGVSNVVSQAYEKNKAGSAQEAGDKKERPHHDESR